MSGRGERPEADDGEGQAEEAAESVALDEGLPERCPNCGTEKEALMWWTED